jgi:small GTP-binding protein
MMLQKKICMLGAFATGKTSLVVQFVHSIFTDKYYTTIGVKIDKKELTIGTQDVNLVLWDLAGEDEFLQVHMSYLRGSSGYLLVADGTRPATLDTAHSLQKRVEAAIGHVPFVLMLNKSDLTAGWEVGEEALANLREKGWDIIITSARSGLGVEEAFVTLVKKILEK